MAKLAVGQKGSRKTAQQPGGEDRNFSTQLWLGLFKSLGTGGQDRRLLRAGNSCHEQLGLEKAVCLASCPFSVVPSLPPSFPQGQGQRRRPPSSPPLWCLQPRGGSDPQQLTRQRHCLSHSPQDTPWAQRPVCSTAATTQAVAPATLNCLPDRHDHRPTPRRVVATNGRRI